MSKLKELEPEEDKQKQPAEENNACQGVQPLPDLATISKYGELLNRCKYDEDGYADEKEFIDFLKTNKAVAIRKNDWDTYGVFYSREGYRAFAFRFLYDYNDAAPQNFRVISGFRKFSDFSFLLDKALTWDDLSEYRDSTSWSLSSDDGRCDAFVVEEGAVIVAYYPDNRIKWFSFVTDGELKKDDDSIVEWPIIDRVDKLFHGESGKETTVV